MSQVLDTDVVVVGSGSAGLFAALVAADAGNQVVVLERTPVLGGTTAISGGQVWMPGNPLMADLGHTDTEEAALAYLRRLTLGRVDDDRLVAFVRTAPEVVTYLLERTPLRLRALPAGDYHPEWVGAARGGRSLECLPFDTSPAAARGAAVREGSQFPAITNEEFGRWQSPDNFDWELVAERMMTGVRTMGGALVGGLVAAALERGVELRTGARARSVTMTGGRAVGIEAETAEGPLSVRARRGTVLATGGYEWNEDLKRSHLRGPALNVVSPPGNEGDGLLMGMAVGAGVENLSEANWVPTFNVPGEEYDGRPMARLAASFLSLPGCILVNAAGRRFVNESMNYADQGHLFHRFDPVTYTFPNIPAWAVFDERFKRTYPAASIMPGDDAPSWVLRGDSPRELATAAGIDPDGLATTLHAYNAAAADGRDPELHRGESDYDRHHGDPACTPNPALAPLAQAPFYAVRIVPGITGTKGGLRTDADGRVLRAGGGVVDGLYAVGSTTASLMWGSYPAGGGNLGPGLVEGYLAATAIGKV